MNDNCKLRWISGCSEYHTNEVWPIFQNLIMTCMQFKLVFPPPQISMSDEELVQHVNKYVELFKEYMEDHLIYVEAYEILRIAEEGSIPQFTELEVAITASYDASVKNLKAYQHLYKEWMYLSEIWLRTYGSKESFPLLMVSDRKAFKRSNQLSHHVQAIDGQFGILPLPFEFVSLASLRNLSFPIQVAFCHDQGRVDVLGMFNAINWKVTFSYRNIRRILLNFKLKTKQDDYPSALDMYFDLLHPPLLFVTATHGEVRQRVSFRRVLEILPILTKHILGKANVLKFSILQNETVFELINRLHFRCHNLPFYFAHVIEKPIDSLEPYLNLNPRICFPDFRCQYLFTAILYRNFSVTEQCIRLNDCQINAINICVQSTDSKHVEQTLTDILFAIDSGKCVYFPAAILSLCRYYELNVERNNIINYIVPVKSRLIRRATLTPTRLLLWPPEIMFENRFLRNYDPDFALRVNFRDDDISLLSWIARISDPPIFYNAVKNPMLRGIQIGTRNFKFLGWSNSQIHDHAVWCYATDNSGHGVADIREWMGNFSGIRVVPKYMARVGQTFTQTENSVSVPLDLDYIRFENDIVGGLNPTTNKPYCFSDGIGKISVKLAKQVHQALGHDKHCSAFQIRYSGCKGMLAIDPTLTDVDIVFRNSMKKFDSPQNTCLEIARISAPVPLHLNRPFITLLNQMGVPKRIFLQLQENHLRTLTDILFDEEKAMKYLSAMCPLNVLKFEALSKSGVELTMEPFFKQLLLTLHLYHIDKIKTKANIEIDPSDGRNLLGVLDETEPPALEYGQVFIQCTKDILFGETTLDTVIIEGPVLVTKNPCMHPGDIRKFTAVDVPALHHIVDCIVFPRQGNRPHPDEMSGSDLDGDEYATIWKKELIFSKLNAPPAQFPAYTAMEKLEITEQDIIEFLVEYIKNDQVGVIAHAHLALADRFGIHDDICKRVAEKFSIAVDYAKSGKTVRLDCIEIPSEIPDFMEKNFRVAGNNEKRIYKSKWALGKLYRICKDFEVIAARTRFKAPIIKVDPLLEYPGWECYESEAIKSRDKYTNLLSSILQTYGVQYEAEAFSGAYTHIHCRFQERKDKDEVVKVVNASIKALCKTMEMEFVSQINDGLENEDILFGTPYIVQSLRRKASAWYIVSYRDPDIGFLSFPWIVSSYLADIKMQNLYPKISLYIRTPIVDRINSVIYSNLESIPALTADAAREFSKCSLTDRCNRDITEVALRVMMLWAYEALIIQDEGYSNRGFLYRHKFAQLFMHVIEISRNKQGPSEGATNHKKGRRKTAAAYCLAFLRFCVSLRFYNKTDAKKYLPFDVRRYKDLGIQAMASYHDIAITGNFEVLDFDKKRTDGWIEMKAEYIETSIFGSTHITSELLDGVKRELKRRTSVKEISLEEHTSTKKMSVYAYGKPDSLLYLRKILRKENMMRDLIKTVKLDLCLGLFN